MFGVTVKMFGLSVGFSFGMFSFFAFGAFFVIVLVIWTIGLTRLGRAKEARHQNEVRSRLNELAMFVARQDMFVVGHPVYSIEENVLYFGSIPVLHRSTQYVRPRVNDVAVIDDVVRWHGVSKEEALNIFYQSDHLSGSEFLKKVEVICEKYKKAVVPGYLETSSKGVDFFILEQ